MDYIDTMTYTNSLWLSVIQQVKLPEEKSPFQIVGTVPAWLTRESRNTPPTPILKDDTCTCFD